MNKPIEVNWIGQKNTCLICTFPREAGQDQAFAAGIAFSSIVKGEAHKLALCQACRTSVLAHTLLMVDRLKEINRRDYHGIDPRILEERLQELEDSALGRVRAV